MKTQYLKWVNIILLQLIITSGSAQVMQVPAQGKNSKTFQTEILFKLPMNSFSLLQKDHNIPARIKADIIPYKPFVNITTKLSARYTPITMEKVNNIMNRYKSIPGGITLEGRIKGLGEITSVVFDRKNNRFIINDKLIYANKVSVPEVKEILNSIYNDDLLGISLGKKAHIYGDLSKGTIPYVNLSMLDHFLGTIVFAGKNWIKYHKFPNNYRPKIDYNSRGIHAVYFNFNNFTVKKDKNILISNHADLDITLIPLTDKKDKNGGFIPDYKQIEKGYISKPFEQNTRHIVQAINEYSKDSRFQKVIAYGYTAALARLFKESNISALKLGLI